MRKRRHPYTLKALYLKGIELARAIGSRYRAHQLTAFAGQMAYFLMLSFFPLMIFSVSIITRLKIDYSPIVDGAHLILPDNITRLLTQFVQNTASVNNTAVLSAAGLTTLYSASKGISALQRALNASYEVQETRNFLQIRLVGMLYTFLFTIILVLTLLVPDLFERALKALSTFFNVYVDEEFMALLHFLRNLFLMGSFIGVIGSVYAVLPNKKLRLRDIYPGALFAIVGSAVTNFGFATIVVALTDYSVLYGSLSAVIAFMIWLYFLSLILIIGAEINAMYLEGKSDGTCR